MGQAPAAAPGRSRCKDGGAAATSAYRPLLEAVNAMGVRRMAGGGAITPGLAPAVLHAQLSGGGGPTHLHNTSRVSVNVGPESR